MADVEKLLTEYVAEHRSGGEADPLAYLEQVEGTDRAELAALIDGYLVRAPGRDWDAAAFEGSKAQALAEGLGRSLTGRSGTWPVLLPRLREKAKVKRADLVERLAGALGVGGQADEVAAYYHRMEQGQLDSRGVSTKVLDALGSIVGSSAEALRSAGEAIGTGAEGEVGQVFARKVTLDAEVLDEAPDAAAGMASPGTAEPERRAEEGPAGEPSEVDRLFTGGD